MAQVVIDRADGPLPVTGSLFEGKKFFLVQRLPSRSRFISDIEANGGRIVRIEKQADYLVADHLRHDAPPGSVSYKFLEVALKDGIIPSEDDYMAGARRGTQGPAGSPQGPVGSTSAPGKSTRTPFTAEDDRVLYEWVRSFEAEGGAVKGNEIYKQLAARVSNTVEGMNDSY